MMKEAHDRTCQACGMAGVVCRLNAGEGSSEEVRLTFLHSCGCTTAETMSPLRPEQTVLVCSLCGYDFRVDVIRDSPDMKLSWITRSAIILLGSLILVCGLPTSLDQSVGAVPILATLTYFTVAALFLFWGYSGKLSTSYLLRLTRLLPVMRRIGCVASILGPTIVLLCLAWLFLRWLL